MRSRLLTLIPVAVALAVPSAAHAATVSAQYVDPPPECSKCGTPTPFSTMEYAAAKGEANDVTWRDDGTTWTVRDAGAPLKAGGSCTSVDEHTATCALPAYAPAPTVAVNLGDGDDRFSAESAARGGSINGGDGNDAIHGAAAAGNAIRADGNAGDDTLTDGASNSTLIGEAGADTLSAGAGDDVLRDGENDFERSADRYDGGEGDDLVSYSVVPGAPQPTRFDRAEGVTVDLAAGTAGAPGEGDVLRSVEGGEGTRANDTLLGDGGANTLKGDLGDDRIVGGDGPDAINTGGGADSAEGGAGNDVLDLVSTDGQLASRPALASCGDGVDAVRPAYGDVPDDCEDVLSETTTRIPVQYGARPIVIGRRAMSFVAPCPAARPRCSTTIRVATATGSDKTIAYGTARKRSSAVLRLKIQRYGKRFLAKHPGARVEVSVSYLADDPDGAVHTIPLVARR
jgi:hypothetical protein